MFLFTLLLTGSLVLPLKTILSGALSICGSFAILMLVFQDNHGAQLLQFRNNFECLDPIQLLFVAVVAFGLALDYEVFLLGRIQEVFRRTGDCHYAIAKGVSSSARVISIASVLICCAIGSVSQWGKGRRGEGEGKGGATTYCTAAPTTLSYRDSGRALP